MPLVDFIDIAKKLTVKVVAWLALGGVGGLTVICFGLWQSLHPGFERIDKHAADVEHIEAEIRGILAYNSDHQALDDSKSILQLKAQECQLPKDAPKDVYAQTIINSAEEYQRLTGRVYNIPACGDL
jgi:hypothetical protein